MGLFERCCRYGLAWQCFWDGAGLAVPQWFSLLAAFELYQVNGVIAVLIWLMIFPMMTQIDFSSLKQVKQEVHGLVLTVVVNWLIKPFTMACLGWLFLPSCLPIC